MGRKDVIIKELIEEMIGMKIERGSRGRNGE